MLVLLQGVFRAELSHHPSNVVDFPRTHTLADKRCENSPISSRMELPSSLRDSERLRERERCRWWHT